MANEAGEHFSSSILVLILSSWRENAKQRVRTALHSNAEVTTKKKFLYLFLDPCEKRDKTLPRCRPSLSRTFLISYWRAVKCLQAL